MPSPSTETDAVCEKKVRSTSGEDGKAIFSARHGGAKVALAGGWEAATRSGNACVARVHAREVGKGWQGRADSLSSCGWRRCTSWSWCGQMSFLMNGYPSG